MKKLARMLLALVLLAIGSAAVTACNTTRGVGEDVENLGEEIQDTSY